MTDCTYSGFAQTFQMLYLIATYCVVFIYLIFLVTIKETMKRYYVQIDRQEGQRVPRGLEEQTSILRGRSCKDFERALAYSLYLLNDGRIGSRAEREYLSNERAKIAYEKLSGAIKTFKYNFSCDEEAIPYEHDFSDQEIKEEEFLPNINAEVDPDDFEMQSR